MDEDHDHLMDPLLSGVDDTDASTADLDIRSITNFADLDVILASTSSITKPTPPAAAPQHQPKPPLKTVLLGSGDTITINPVVGASGGATAGKVIAKVMAPKPSAAATIAAGSGNITIVPSQSGASGGVGGAQQFVIFQNQNGKAQQIRLSTAPAAGSSGAASSAGLQSGASHPPISGNIQLIKSSDGGSFIQLKPAAGPMSSQSPAQQQQQQQQQVQIIGNAAVANMQPQKCLVLKNSAGQRVVLGAGGNLKITSTTVAQAGVSGATTITPATMATMASTPTINTVPRTMTVAQAQKMGILSTAKLKELVTAAKAQKEAKQQQHQQHQQVQQLLQQEHVVVSEAAAPATATPALSDVPEPAVVVAESTPEVQHDSTSNAPPATTTTEPPPATTVAPVPVSLIATSSVGAPSVVTAPPTINQKITIQTSDGSKKHVLLPPNLYKMAQQGQIKAVNIAGKGVQYLRINTSAPGAGVSTAPAPTATTAPHAVRTVVATTSSAAATSAGVFSGTVTVSSSNGKPFTKFTVLNAAVPSTSSSEPAAPASSSEQPARNAERAKVSSSADARQAEKRKSDAAGFIKIEQPKTKVPNSSGTAAANHNAPATLLNRTLKMEETIDPEMLVRRTTLPSAESRRSQNQGAGGTLNQSASGASTSVVTYTFGTPRKQHGRSSGNIVTDTVTATMMLDYTNAKANAGASGGGGGGSTATATNSESDLEGPRRKHCNCTKSQCLKLYCDCFANGEFCKDCNCKDCFNNIEYEAERQNAIKICLERNPHAFKPKIGKSKDESDTRRHNKGCNCKRSGCLKNYCECYEAKIACSANCKCIDCHNMDDLNASVNEEHHHSQLDTSVGGSSSGLNRSALMELELLERQRSESPDIPPKKPCNFMTQDVIEATIQCVIAQADECQKNHLDARTSEKLILEEFGRCLVEIIEFSLKNPADN